VVDEGAQVLGDETGPGEVWQMTGAVKQRELGPGV
jgi:hypothetical protein